jgi:hypothetical protein
MTTKTKVIIWVLMHSVFAGTLIAAAEMLRQTQGFSPVLCMLLLITVYHVVGATLGAMELAKGPDEE